MTIKLNLTPEQEKLVEAALIVNEQTLEEFFMSAVSVMGDRKNSKLPHIVKPAKDAFTKVSVNEDGAIIIPKDAPQELKDWVEHG